MTVASSWVFSETLTGLQIVEKSKQNAKGFEDMTHTVKMILIDDKGETNEREMLVKAMTDENGNAYSLSIFTAPRRENGISLLTVADKGGEDKQYLYLPSTRRVKRITSSNQGSSFRGSEFTFEDLSDQSVENYRFELVKEAPCGDQTCFVVDRFPKSEDSGYSKTEMWIDTQHYRPIKANFFDRDGKLLKTMDTENYRLFNDKFWNPELVTMTNKQTGNSTKMVSVELRMNSGLKTSEFTELAMRNWR